MTIGDPRSWDELFPADLLPVLFAYVIETWYSLPKPGESEHEDKITVRLYSKLVNGKDRNKHPFLIRCQDMEVDTEAERETGKKDLVFFPSHEEEIYFCFEAKRLNALISGSRRALAHEYVTEGMQRFVDGQYSGSVRHCGMLGYVLDGDTGRALWNVETSIHKHKDELRLVSGNGFNDSTIRPDDSLARETAHLRVKDDEQFLMHHVFLSTASAS